jgi:four helix bundle protein
MQIANCKLSISEGAEGASTAVGNEQPMTPEVMCDRILDFADRVATVVDALPETRLGNRIANQLLGSGMSSIGNYEEACAAESKNDFVHKLRICLKEVRESRGWLRLTARRKLVPPCATRRSHR